MASYVRRLVENFMYLFVTVCWILLDALIDWTRQFRRGVMQSHESLLKDRLRNAQNYNEWREAARQLDIILGNDQWRQDPVSNDYDFKLIAARLRHLRHAREMEDVPTMVYRLRAGLLRNLGGLSETSVFRRSLLGTKHLIEEYTEEVVSQLEYIARTSMEGFTQQSKFEFFSDTRQSFGNTALLLNGGVSFGLYHLGVVKCLHEHDLLPRIITGTSVGALIAALVCVHTDRELPAIFHSSGINLSAFTRKGEKGSIKRKFLRLMKHGHLMDVSVLDDCVRSNVGDITFEEAFNRTKRILNIVVSSTRKNEVPRLLNYLTAPNVLIRSAATASCAVTGLYDQVPLLAKDHNGHIVTWNSSSITWSDASIDDDGPTLRLAELFNVNHIILSQANPYMLPFMKERLAGDGFFSVLTGLAYLEIRHRFFQLNQLGLIPQWMKGFLDYQVAGNVNIAPDISFRDYRIVFSNPTAATLDHWILKGEHACWPHLALIKNRCAIELALDRILLRLKADRASSR